jgi:anti-sigma-K factor RskA
MASASNNYPEFLNRQRRQEPPPMASGLERQVMAAVQRRENRERIPALWRVSMAVAGVLVMIAAVYFTSRRSEPPLVPANSAVVESVMMLDHHVCIWLEPLEVPTGRSHP